MARQANPQLQTPRMFSRSSRTRGSSDFFKELDEILKRNKGGFSTLAEDTGATPGFIVPGGMATRFSSQAPEIAGQTGSTIDRPVYPEIPQSEGYQPQEQQPLPDGGQAQGFLDQLYQSYFQTNPEALEQYVGSRAIASTVDGGTLFEDGTIYYSDGSFRQGDPSAQAIASMPDGSIRYSDGSIKQSVPGGLQGLIQGIFGQDRAITQEFGNYNPELEPGSGYNLGTDIRTRDLQGNQRAFALPVEAEVVQVFRDDGTRWGDQSGHQGYGNSVLLRLPSGEMLRFSHLSNLADLNVGDTIGAGQSFGTPGATGNVTGEHLDLEYYNSEGQIADPSQFSGFVDPSSLRQQGQQEPQMSQAQPQQQPTGMLQSVMQARQEGRSILDSIPTISEMTGLEQVQQAIPATQPMSPERQQLGESVNRLGQQAGQVLGVSEFTDPGFIGAGEAVSGDFKGAGKELSSTIERANPTPRIDLGISEALRGDFQGAKKNITDTLSRIGNRVERLPGQIASSVVDQAYASDGQDDQKESLSENISGGIRSAGEYFGDRLGAATDFAKGIVSNQPEVDVSDASEQQAGAGLDRLKGSREGSPLNIFSRVKPEELSGDRVVGQSSGGDLLGTAPTVSQARAKAVSDTSDPFFSSPVFEKLRGFTNFADGEPGPNQALSLDIFSDRFYESPERTSEVFGKTFLSDPALAKATEKVKDSFRQRYSGDEYDQADVDRILSSLPQTLSYTPNLPEPSKVQRSQGGQSMSSGQSQGGMSVAPRQSSGSSQRQSVNYTPANANMTSAKTGQPVRSNYTPKPSKPQMSVAPRMSYAPQPKQSSSVFDRAKNFASGIFKRFFN